MAETSRQIFAFGPFRIDLRVHHVTRDGQPVDLSPRAFDLLLALARREGALATKAELMDEVWGDVAVEEGNLTQTVFVLRRLLGEEGDRLIATVPRRGYRLAVPVVRIDDPPASTSQASVPAAPAGIVAAAGSDRPRAAEGPAVSARRRAWPVLLAGVVLVAAVVGMFWSAGPGRSAAISPSDGALVPRRLTSATDVTGAAISPDGKFVAYTRQGTRPSIRLLQVSTGQEVEVMSGAGESVSFPSFSADGEWLYFVRQGADGASFLMRTAVLGGPVQPIVANVSSAAAASPDGRQLAFVRWNPDAGTRTLMVSDADGRHARPVLERRSPEVIMYGGLTWSSDGRRVAAIVNESFGGSAAALVEADVASGTSRTVAGDLPWRARGVRMLCDGKSWLLAAGPIFRIGRTPDEPLRLTLDTAAYGSIGLRGDCGTLVAVQDNESWSIWVADAQGAGGRERDGGALRPPALRRHLTEAGFNHGLAWLPDGRLAYESDADGNPDVWIASADGRARVRTTDASGIDGFPAVTPDGGTVVFASAREGGSAIWRAGIDGAGARRLSPPGAAYAPDISPDGRSVVYHAADPARSWRTWRVPIEGGAASPLADGASTHAVHSPDGRLVACNYLVERGAKKTWVIALVPANGGAPVRLLNVEGPPTRRLAWMPDGRGLLATNPGDRVQLVPADGSPPSLYFDADGESVTAIAWSRDGSRLALVRHQRSGTAVLFEVPERWRR